MASKATSGLLRIVSGLKTRQGYTSGGSTSSGGSSGGSTSGGGSSNVELKYYRADGTAVYGRIGESTVLPSGATAAPGANLSTSANIKTAEPKPTQQIYSTSEKQSLGSAGSFSTLKSDVPISRVSKISDSANQGFSSAYSQAEQNNNLSSFEKQIKPEYRQTSSLNNYFRPGVVSSIDATDTKRKRDKLIEETRLRDQERARIIEASNQTAKKGNTVSSLSPELERRTIASQKRNTDALSLSGFGEGLYSGFFLTKQSKDLVRDGTFSQKAGTIAGGIGAAASLYWAGSGGVTKTLTTATTASKAGTSVKTALQPLARSTAGKSVLSIGSRISSPVTRVLNSPAAVRTGQVLSKVKNVPGVPLTLNVVKGAVYSGSVVQSVKYGSGLTAPKDQRNVIFTNDFRDYYRAGVQAQQAEASKGGINIPFTNRQFSAGALRSELTLGFASKSERQAFRTGVTQSARKAGITDAEIENVVFAAERQRKANIAGETLGLLTAGIVGESVGQDYVTKKFASLSGSKANVPAKSAGFYLAKTVFNPIGKAGIVEGVASVTTQNLAREEPIKLKNVAIGAGAGYLSAGVIGSSIVGLSANKPTLSKVGQGLAYITDPYEFPSDFLERKISSGVARATGKKIVSPVITVTNPAAVPAFTLTTSTTTKTPEVRKARTKGLFSVGSFTTINTKTKTPVNVNTNLLGDISVRGATNINIPEDNTPIKTNTDIPIDNTPVNTAVNTDIPVNIPPINTNTNTFIDSPVNTNVNTPVNTNIFTSVPVVTPLLRLAPPIPPIFPFGTGGGAGSKRVKKKKYVNELDQALGLFNDNLIGFGSFNQKKKPAIKARKKRR